MNKKAILSRKEFAQYLRELSSEIESGEINFDNIKEKIPENLDVKYKFKNKDGFSKIKFSFKWPSEQASEQSLAYTSSKPNKYSYKETKNQFAILLGSIDKILSENKIPTEEQVKNIIDIAEASIESSKPKYKSEMNEVKTAIIELKQAIDTKNIVLANSAMENLKQLEEKYHKIYKE